jgi:hypothetical protein
MGPAHSAAFVGGLAALKPTPTPQVHGPDERQGACYRGHGDYPEEHIGMLSPSRFAFGCNYIVTQEGAVCNMGVSSSVNDGFGSYAADFA